MSAVSALVAGRAAAEDLMIDTCTVTRGGTRVYQGKVRLQTASKRPPNVEAGMQIYEWNVLDLLAFLPTSAADLADGDTLRIDKSIMNEHLTGKTFRVRAMLTPKSMETKRTAVLSQVTTTYLPDSVVIVTAAVVTDDYGNRSMDWARATRATVDALVQPLSSTEARGSGERDQTVTQYEIWVGPDAVVTARDRIEWNGLTLAVDGEPQLFTDTSGDPHHKVFTATVSKG